MDLSYAVKVCRARGQDGRGQQGGAQLWRDQARGLQGVKHLLEAENLGASV